MENKEKLSKIIFDKLTEEKHGENLNFTEKRILKDLEEFETQVDPAMGISATPLLENIYEWHCNIKGFEETPYENGIFHLKIEVPKDYPKSSPTVLSMTPFHNAFFSGNKYTSEMLQEEWCSGFSVCSILTQIQAGFWDFIGSHQNQIKQEARDSLEYNCPECEHNGLATVWPSFETHGLKTYDKMTEEERLIEDTYCFHTRMNISQRLATLGTGVAF
jgi:ubiquitin-protein ligase